MATYHSLYSNIRKITHDLSYLTKLGDLVTKDCYSYIWTHPDMITKVQFNNLVYIIPEETCAHLLKTYKIPVAYICTEKPECDKFITCLRFTNYTDILQCYNIEEQKIIINCIFKITQSSILMLDTDIIEYLLQYITITEYPYIVSYINQFRDTSKEYLIRFCSEVWCNNLTIITNHYDDLVYISSLRSAWITACTPI